MKGGGFMKKKPFLLITLFTLSGLFVSYFLILQVIHGTLTSKLIMLILSGFTLSLFIYFVNKYEKDMDKKRSIIHQICIIIFVVYLIQLLSMLFFEGGFGRNEFQNMSFSKIIYHNYLKHSFNLIPFKMIFFYINGFLNGTKTFMALCINLFGNFVAFMPMAIFLPILIPKLKKPKQFLLFMIFMVASIELLQMVLLTGCCDIDDLILNVSGSMIVYIIVNKTGILKLIKKRIGD